MLNVPISTVRNRELSLWQSAVAQTVRAEIAETEPTITLSQKSSRVFSHPMVIAAAKHAALASEHGYTFSIRTNHTDGVTTAEEDAAILSELYFNIAKAQIKNDTELLEQLNEEVRKFSTKDPGWLTCVTTFLEYLSKYHTPFYNSPTGKGSDYSVIPWKLPDDAVVAVIGDWGTGMDDAIQLLTTIMKQHSPTAIIHLGDIYYSGTPDECQAGFLGVFDTVLGTGKRIPIFTLPGNHEYYCMGAGFFQDVLGQVNQDRTDCIQEASFFSLRTQDGVWQFLGMDTGYNDFDPFNEIDPWAKAPRLRDDEILWHQDKLDNFSGKTILLSHHQLYSANAALNGKETGYPPNHNTFLADVFSPYFSKVAAWFWGHEHNQVLYQDNLLGLAKGRLIGASAYEETTGETPYKVNYPDVPYLSANAFQLSAAENYYNHGYAVINFKRAKPTNPIEICYFQYPSWGGEKSDPPKTSAWVYTESLDTPEQKGGAVIYSGVSVQMRLNGYGYLGAIDSVDQLEYYPMISNIPVLQTLTGPAINVSIKEGDTISIQTTQLLNQPAYNTLGAWDTPALYYSMPGSHQEQWVIKKRYPTEDPQIRYGEEIYFLNDSGKKLCALNEDGATYLTAAPDASAYWVLQPPASAPLSALASGGSRLDVFTHGLDAVALHKSYNGTWAGTWDPLDGQIAGPPIAVSWGDQRLDVFARGTDDGVWHKWSNNGGATWLPSPTDWDALGGQMGGRLSAVAWGKNRLDIFARGTDIWGESNGGCGTSIWHRWSNDGRTWNPANAWDNLGGDVAGTPIAVSWGKLRLDVFARGANGDLLHRWSSDGQTWNPALGWGSLGGLIVGDPAVVSWGPGRLDVFARGTDGAIWHKYYDGASWQPSATDWTSLGGTMTGDPAAVSWGPGRLDVFARGTNGELLHKWSNDGQTWNPADTWDSLGGTVVGDLSAVSWGGQRLDVFVRGTNGAVWHIEYNGTWQPWKPV